MFHGTLQIASAFVTNAGLIWCLHPPSSITVTETAYKLLLDFSISSVTVVIQWQPK